MFQNADSYIVFSPQNRFYFSGFRSSFGCVVVTKTARTLITDLRYASEARDVAVGCSVLAITASEFYPAIKSVLTESNAKTVGYEDEYVTVADFAKISSRLEGFDLVPASKEIADSRMIKSDEEVAAIATAQAVTQRAFLKTLSLIKPGVTEKEISDEIAYQLLRHGAQELAFESIVAFGVNTANPHHHPTVKKLEKNDLITIDIGAKVNGYCGDMTRTFCLGTPNEKLAEIHRIVLEAQAYAIDNLRVGLPAKTAHILAAEYISANGYGNEFLHSLGHGVGLDIHERPFLSPSSEDLIQANTVFSVEPGVYVDGLGGVRIEDLVAVKPEGVVNLTLNVSKNINL